MLVYAGGPIDYAKPGVDSHDWRHSLEWLGVAVYCPVCVGRSGLDDSDVILANREALLLTADAAVFRLDGQTIGTAIEVDYWLTKRGASSMVIVHPPPHGLFVRIWAGMRVAVVDDMEGAMAWLGSRLLKTS